jgi:phosphatidate phosphatase LPIN
VEFRVNGVKQDFSMKLGEGGEAFFVFETTEDVPAALQTSPLVSPASSPNAAAGADLSSSLQEPPDLDLDLSHPATAKNESKNSNGVPIRSGDLHISNDLGMDCRTSFHDAYSHRLQER